MEFMALIESPLEDSHHHSSFLLDKEILEKQLHNPIDYVNIVGSIFDSPNPSSEGTLGNISKTISIDISIKP